MRLAMILAAALLIAGGPAMAQTSGVAQTLGAEEVAAATSPDGVIRVALRVNGEGRVGYTVARAGTPLIDESQLGFLFTDAPQMLRNFAMVGQAATRDADATWEQP